MERKTLYELKRQRILEELRDLEDQEWEDLQQLQLEIQNEDTSLMDLGSMHTNMIHNHNNCQSDFLKRMPMNRYFSTQLGFANGKESPFKRPRFMSGNESDHQAKDLSFDCRSPNESDREFKDNNSEKEIKEKDHLSEDFESCKSNNIEEKQGSEDSNYMASSCRGEQSNSEDILVNLTDIEDDQR